MREIKKYYLIPAEPEIVFAGLTNPNTIRLWTGEEAEMSTEAGTEFSLWEGSICGKNLEFEPGKKIVQQWYFGEAEKPSIVTIKLHPHKDGTSAELHHTNIPEEDLGNMQEGWDNDYFGALIAFYQD